MSKLLKLILIVYVARVLGATEYGKFTFALAFISLFVILQEFGIPDIITREFAREKEREKEFSSIISLKILLTLGALLLVLVASFFVTSDPGIQKTIWILAVFSSLGNFSKIIYAFFRARQKMEYESWAVILEAVVITGVGFFVIFNLPSIINLSYGYLFSTLTSLIFVLTLLHFKGFPLCISWEKSIWKKFLGMSWPLALTSFFTTIYIHIDSVMMGYWGQATETGWYNAAYGIITATTVPMGVIASSFYPVLSKFFKKSKQELQTIWNYQMGLMIMLAVPLMFGGVILAPNIIDFVYGENFTPSVLAFQILILVAGISFLSSPLWHILVVSNQQKKLFWITSSGAAINVILNFILIPKFSLYGAAVATVITYLLILLLFFGFTFKYTTINPLHVKLLFYGIAALFSSIVMYLVLQYLEAYMFNALLRIGIGFAIYFFTFFMLKFVLKYIYLLSIKHGTKD